MKYKSKPCIVDAVQWMKPGDHPRVRPWQHEHGSGFELHFHEVYPGDYILTHSDGRLEVMSEAEFLSKYEKEVVWKYCAACKGWGKRDSRGYDWCPTCHGTGKVEE